MSASKTIKLTLTRQEAHALQRAIGMSAVDEKTADEDKTPLIWVGRRLMPLLAASDEAEMVAESPDCRNCLHCWCECGEDIVCGHGESRARSAGFGLSVNASRRESGPCGPSGKLFTPKVAPKEAANAK